VEWEEDGVVHLSVVFSWDLPKAYQKAVWYGSQGYRVVAGGPAVILEPSYLQGVAQVGGHAMALQYHNPDATFTSRGCIRRCSFCPVSEIEGDLRELTDWKPKSIVCDNNLLACSRVHFDRVVDRLKPLSNVDFNQGLDVRLLTSYHADRLAELDLKAVRLAWDHTSMESQFMAAVERLRDAGVWKRKFRVYVLIGFNDTPDDALYRLRTVRGLGLWPNPMRYQPVRAPRKNSYVAAGWTDQELTRYMRYWSNLRRLGGIPFEEFDYGGGGVRWRG
jgi:hypothetical protein